MELRAISRWWLPALLATLAWALTGCATSPVEESPPGGSGGSEPTGGAGGGTGGAATGGAAGEGGGTGGSTGLCAVDCASIETPQCLMAVCNEGRYVGIIGECVVVDGPAGEPCDDGLFCTTGDSCFEGECHGGPQNDCGISPPTCQDVVCHEGSQSCSTTPSADGTICISTNLCQINASCTNGLCSGSPKDCFFSPLNECNAVACNPATGDCEGTPDPGKDGQSCVNSGDLCMEGKTCDSGQCVGGTPKDCSHLTENCDNGVCSPTSGLCITEPVPPGGTCFDIPNPDCNTGTCDANGTCQPSPIADGTPCEDYNSCTSSDVCTAGVCGGTVDPTCSIYFEANFESCQNGWTLGGNWECGVPSNVGPAAAVSGSQCLGTTIDGNYDNGQTWAGTVADTPPIDLSLATEPLLSFWLWINTEGYSYDGGNLKISTDGGASFSILSTDLPYNLSSVDSQPAWGGDLSAAGWQLVTADLMPYLGQTIILRFAFRSDGSVIDPGIYVDDVMVSEAAGVPLAITTASLPDAVQGNPYSVQMTKTGGSSGSVWSIVPGGINDGWLSINAGGLLTGNPGPADLGPVTVTIRVEEPSDPSNFDEQTFSFEVVSAIYFESFEGACPNGWTLLPEWECGTPSNVGPPVAHSGSQCLGTVIDGDYSNNNAWDTTTATSPPLDLTTATSPTLSFWRYVHTESCCDGGNVKISTDGVSFTLLSNVVPAYTGTINSQSAYNGDLSSWQEVTADLSAYIGGTVYLRFAFRSDGSVVYPGVYIDDVMVTD